MDHPEEKRLLGGVCQLFRYVCSVEAVDFPEAWVESFSTIAVPMKSMKRGSNPFQQERLSGLARVCFLWEFEISGVKVPISIKVVRLKPPIQDRSADNLLGSSVMMSLRTKELKLLLGDGHGSLVQPDC